ncbi:hypothetical protein OSB04_025795 [Centaurea solstitialis]|uniref:Uncharacterized protein n=1 Tax=Centaurea solstitialis TaxID=347529 RepID=A0AA38SPB9_9ASTR|nr:hypothetical protein OSB04_025795 [Centaurea solstitialis]
MNALPSNRYMDSMMNVKEDPTLNYERLSLIASTACLPFTDLNNLDQIRILKRPTDMTDSGLLYDFFWSNPCKDKHDLDLVCHAHQVSISTLGFPCLCCSYHLKMINHLAFHAHERNAFRMWKTPITYSIFSIRPSSLVAYANQSESAHLKKDYLNLFGNYMLKETDGKRRETHGIIKSDTSKHHFGTG